MSEETNICGCGRPAKYDLRKVGETKNVWSCNGHFRCLTYEELRAARQREYVRLGVAENVIRHYATVDDEWLYALDVTGSPKPEEFVSKAQEYLSKYADQEGK